MSRTNVDLDDEACEQVMRIYKLKTKREAVNFSLRRAARTPMTKEEILAMQGTGWGGDLDDLRRHRLDELSGDHDTAPQGSP